jgi:hypothetical protein
VSEFGTDSPQKVELYNTGTSVVDLSSWYIDDDGGSSTYFTIPTNSYISPSQCVVFSGAFNLNTASADQVRLFDMFAPPSSSSARLIDSHAYTGSPGTGKSYARNPHTSNNWVSQLATFGSLNDTQADCTVAAPTPSATPTPSGTILPSITFTPTPIQVHTPTPSITPTLVPSATPQPTSTPMPKIYLNEVFPNPTDDQPEWVELYNGSNFEVDLQGWSIDDIENGGSSPIILAGVIQPHQLFVFDMTKTIFNNTGDNVRLIDTQGTVVEIFLYDHTDVAMSWAKPYPEATYFCIQSPSRAQTNFGCSTQIGAAAAQSSTTPTKTPSFSPTPTVVTPDSIVLSEIYPQPSADENEWIEIFNDSDQEAYLRDWYIDDVSSGGSAPRQFSMNIAPQSFGVIEFSQQLLNNDGDTVQLLNPQKVVVESFTYSMSQENFSIAKSDLHDSSWCLQTPSRGAGNTSCIAPSPTPTKRPTSTPRPTATPRVGVTKNTGGSAVLGKSTQSSTSTDGQSGSTKHIDTIVFNDSNSDELSYAESSPSSMLVSKRLEPSGSGWQNTIVDMFQVILGMIMGVSLWQLFRASPPT